MTIPGLDNLYRQVIMDYGRHPHHFHLLDETWSDQAKKYNPSCGDIIQLGVKFDGDKLAELAFDGDGCAICKASASMMTDILAGQSLAQAKKISHEFSEMLTTENAASDDLGDAQLLAGVKQFPTRIKCATLPWHALDEILSKQDQGGQHGN
ncbi:Fe-S cluster assembly sulfur transfer protein SufU [Eupransor demetentiae]|uniref:NifU family (IscU) n=1 Tax=Eupransor demetentiae TaxID=3109584 RepID=A0ABP0EMJ6_9LACO|nr:Fe-S cluster assembly scaffold protein IscU [Lactobacillaceae bacterium LMG 33000]